MDGSMPANPRIIMLGTGDFALPTLLRLVESGHHVIALVTQPDRPQGRKQELIPSQIKLAAIERGIAVDQPEDVNAPEAIEHIRQMQPDLLVTAAYGQILSSDLLSVPSLGGINLHGSVLPAYRGAAPVARAIQNGEVESGVTVIRMNPRVDAGGMLAVARTPIGPDETAGELEGRLAELGAPLVVKVIDEIVAGSILPIPQEKARVTKAPKLRKEDGQIDWTKTARQVHNVVRAMQPWPTASTLWHPTEVGKEPLRLIVHRTAVVEGAGQPGQVLEAAADRLIVAAKSGALRILAVQVPGKKAMAVAEFLRGHHVLEGDRLGP
jgi:methionyl-tRNA formyltransferase